MKVYLKDGSFLEIESGLTPLDVSNKISSSLSKKVITVVLNGETKPVSPFTTLRDNDHLELITEEKNHLSWLAINSTVALLLTSIIKNKYNLDDVQWSVNENGFLVKLDSKKFDLTTPALKLLLSKKIKSVTNSVNFLTNPNKISNVDIEIIHGAFDSYTIFGFGAISKDYFEDLGERFKDIRERDHRRIGREMELFFIDPIHDKGFPIWLPNGVELKEIIKNFIHKQEKKYGFVQVETPVLGSKELYITSGHYAHYKDNMFPEMTIEDKETFILRPMACPHHCLVFNFKPRSYRDLPLRIAESVKQYRYESSGSLLGLERVRGMELTDSHIFIRKEELRQEISNTFDLIKSTLDKFKIDINYIELALHDPDNSDKYHNDEKLWMESEEVLREYLKSEKIEFIEKIGEAAFYGPKIDIQIKTALGHIITLSTLQLDFLLASKFELSFKNHDNEDETPIILHRGLIGTYERFISILLEQTKGDLPMWLVPQQAIVILVNDKPETKVRAMEIFTELESNNVRVSIDDSNESVGFKIRKAQTQKIKTQIVVGDEEVGTDVISVKFFGEEDVTKYSMSNLLKVYKDEN